MIYLLIYLVFGLPSSIAGAMINNDRPLVNRILFALMMLPLWPLFAFAMLREILTRRKVMTTCAWCGKVVAPISEWNNAEIWVEHHRSCPNHPLKPERDALNQRVQELERQLEVACHVKEGDKEGFDWAILDKIFKANQRVTWARELINHAVELMTDEQLSQWDGVRAWLETGEDEQ